MPSQTDVLAGRTAARQKLARRLLVDRYKQLYPALAKELEGHYRQVCARIDRWLEQWNEYSQGKRDSAPSLKAAAKNEYWELMLILQTADPELPVQQMYDDYCQLLDNRKDEATAVLG